jgi:hypothetical protein
VHVGDQESDIFDPFGVAQQLEKALKIVFDADVCIKMVLDAPPAPPVRRPRYGIT